ncbi:serine hydrolase [Kitasatospora herbaricolor]|uniref:serine hydrolase domain-containing protein n=1 Tax=Kitasatospora herbaricolor TaxID=68217 RepID=UPI001749F3C1|nr:serine hydrolase domain-containing protein [Kitasatospora herbaricolor]MDQ0307131.1 D-alanyl-D-alanine carboxypeptidase [Kitasatospora herbaricolor]GGV29155.1 serine hydrolase [Kitasatospora herbaricolor]
MRDRTERPPRPSAHRPAGRRRAVPAAAAVAVGLLTAGVLAPPAVSAPRPDTVRQRLDALVRDDGLPAALASVRDRAGRTRTYTAGVGDLSTGAKVPADGQVRIGSTTKTFTAVVVLQLVGEGRIELDATVDTYLPGLVRGEGIDGRLVTVRQLLQHTSGLPEYEGDVDDALRRHRYLEPRDILDIALRHKSEFAPGAKFGYSSTNYLLAGLIVQKVTGRPLAEEVDRRVIRRIGLRHTSFPAPGDMTIREAHPLGYQVDSAGAPPRDTTEIDPSPAWAAGQMISTNADLNQFFTALLDGRLLPAAQLAQMRATVPIGDSGAGYGLGIISRPLSCGGVYWGHGGDIPGYESRGGVTDEGRAASITVTSVPSDFAVTERLEVAVDAALCG